MNMRMLGVITYALALASVGCGAGTDGTGADSGARIDTGVLPPDGGDGNDASTGSADTGVVTDAGSGSAEDAAVETDAAVVCMPVHPVIGPPRTCERGSCLCVGTDACFTADVVDACCEGTFECARPEVDCMEAHPIIGPPRTCESGSCYCASPDACFPMDRAEGCCAVPVVCVP